MSHSVYIAYGTNLGDREENIRLAIERIDERVGRVQQKSSIVESEPLVIPDNPDFTQPAFLNGVLSVSTDLTPVEVLDTLLNIEKELGRIRNEDTVHWGPRTIDLDIIAYDDSIINTDRLTVPHPEMQNRSFVVCPLAEIAPDWHHPVTSKSIRQLVDELKTA